MSTQINHYVLWGFRLAFDDVEYEQIEGRLARNVKDGEVGVVYQGMTGQGVWIGVIHSRCGEGEGFEPTVLPDMRFGFPVEGNAMVFSEWKRDVTQACIDAGLAHSAFLGRALEWHIVTHWS